MEAAPPFTPETAREMQRRSIAARMRRKKVRQAKLAAAIQPKEQPTETDASAAIKLRIADVIARMERAKSNKEIARLSLVAERLWNMVYPKAGSRKPARDDGRRRALPAFTDAANVTTDIATRDSETRKPQ